MSHLSRRQFLNISAATTLGFMGLRSLMRETANASPRGAAIAEGFGPLHTDPQGLLDLPEGFEYRIISRAGQTMDDGFKVPGRPDGMAAFAGPNGRVVLVRNHELDERNPELGPFGQRQELRDKAPADRVYDRTDDGTPCLGGTTTLLYNPATGELEGQRLSLTGTMRNCAGGPTPWNTWVTCEETVRGAGDNIAKDHGYNFEVKAEYGAPLAEPAPLLDMGRFNHEAIAVHPPTGIVYQTEDRGDGLLYRFLPNTPGKLADGGRLQAMAIADRPSLDTRNWDEPFEIERGTRLPVTWLDMEDVHAPEDDLRRRGFDAGAARFARGEGMWYGSDEVYFACTSGGHARKGQIWRYVPSAKEGTTAESKAPGYLELFVEPNDGGLVDNADNLTVAPWGDLIVCEDGSGEQYLVGVTPEGGIYKFAHNAISDSEFAGATFAPGGETLFVNIQVAGLTLAITGPWRKA